MPINFGEIFTGKGKQMNQAEPVNKSLDGKENLNVNLPKQYPPFLAYSPPTKGEVDDQSKKIPWGGIPFLKPIQFPKEHSQDLNKGDTSSNNSTVPKASFGALQWTTAAKVKQKKKELNMFSPSSF